MAYWPEIIRDKPFVSVLVVVMGAVVAWVVWFLGTLWGPAVWVPLTALVLTCVAIYAWYQAMREARALAATDTFSFAEVVVRMHARERAQALINAERRERALAAR
jgi:hypothetical protein